MPTLVTRASKGSELTHNELDANFTRTVSQKTTTYSCLVGDNRSVIECNHASTPFTVTLGDAATMAAADTGDYEVTIANIGAALVTVARAGSDTIDGGTSLSLPQYTSVTLKVNSAQDGYSIISKTGAVNTTEVTYLNAEAVGGLRVTVIDIGDWDMDTTSPTSVAHGLTRSTIRAADVIIRNDADSAYYKLSNYGQISFTDTNVSLARDAGSVFDSTSYDSTSYNRGWITIWYTQ